MMKQDSINNQAMSYFLYTGLAIALVAILSGKYVLLIGALLACYPALLLYYRKHGDL